MFEGGRVLEALRFDFFLGSGNYPSVLFQHHGHTQQIPVVDLSGGTLSVTLLAYVLNLA